MMSVMTTEQRFNLALQHHQAGRLNDAEKLYREILSTESNHAESLHFLGVLALQIGKYDAAVTLIGQAAVQMPENAAVRSDLGVALKAQGKLDLAADAYRAALQLAPDSAEIHNNLGDLLCARQQLEEAVGCFRRALALKGDYEQAHFNLGVALKEQGHFAQAIDAYRAAIRLKPDSAKSYYNLGNALRKMWLLDEAIDAYRTAVRLKPDFTEAHSNLVFGLHYHPRCSASEIGREARRWNEQHARALEHLIGPHANDRDPHRRLRINDLVKRCQKCFVELGLAIVLAPVMQAGHPGIAEAANHPTHPRQRTSDRFWRFQTKLCPRPRATRPDSGGQAFVRGLLPQFAKFALDPTTNTNEHPSHTRLLLWLSS